MQKNKKIKIIPLGGLNEIGKNLTLFEYDESIVILDCGLTFPDEKMLGVDMVIPDIAYLKKKKNKIVGIVITHGHEDHVGALPYVLKEIKVPVYGTKLTMGIVKNKLKEHGMVNKVKLNVIKQGQTFNLGTFKIEFIRSNHSIADAVAVAFHTPDGIVLHTGDFKIDSTPIDGDMIDLARIGELGNEGILLLLSDSTNAERPGFAMSESSVGSVFDKIFQDTNQRIFVATFASNIHRVQQIIDSAAKLGKKVAVSGRNMENILEVATELGYMKIPQNTLIKIDEINRYSKEQLVIVTTGSQGEPMSALSRMAISDHKKVVIERGDLVIISANPIPGNEKAVSNVVNELFKRGADVIYESLSEVHVSGHACQEELKIILGLAKPKYFVPVHGEYRHLQHHKRLARKMGIQSKNIFIMEVGKVLEVSKDGAKITGTVPSGVVLVDGLGVGDVGSVVLKDRKHLAQDGLIIVAVTIEKATGAVISGPDVVSRGFVYVKESEDLIEDIKNVTRKALEKCENKQSNDLFNVKLIIKNTLNSYLFAKTKRRPMVLPVIMEIFNA